MSGHQIFENHILLVVLSSIFSIERNFVTNSIQLRFVGLFEEFRFQRVLPNIRSLIVHSYKFHYNCCLPIWHLLSRKVAVDYLHMYSFFPDRLICAASGNPYAPQPMRHISYSLLSISFFINSRASNHVLNLLSIRFPIV